MLDTFLVRRHPPPPEHHGRNRSPTLAVGQCPGGPKGSPELAPVAPILAPFQGSKVRKSCIQQDHTSLAACMDLCIPAYACLHLCFPLHACLLLATARGSNIPDFGVQSSMRIGPASLSPLTPRLPRPDWQGYWTSAANPSRPTFFCLLFSGLQHTQAAKQCEPHSRAGFPHHQIQWQ